MSARREIPGPGQESIWDYPQPPAIEACSKHIEIYFAGVKIADTRRCQRMLEQGHPPTYYIPPDDVDMQCLAASPKTSLCEHKGEASCYHVISGEQRAVNAVWSYRHPTGQFAAIAGYLAFYAHRMEACYVDGEKVTLPPGKYYGGWITRDVVGPF
jgi:uncharacterized protein (DUF427 family)